MFAVVKKQNQSLRKKKNTRGIIKRKNKVIMKKAIAMKCSREDWDSIKDLIPKKYIDLCCFGSFKNDQYLVNNLFGIENKICNISFVSKKENERTVHETFNAKIFLDACGIETRPTLEQVKEYFKDAEIVESCYKNDFIIGEVSKWESEYQANELEDGSAYHTIWTEKLGYAKIITYKQQKFEITKEQILELANHTFLAGKWFPEVFKKELEAGKWYKGENTFINIVDLKSNRAYGFNIFKEWENECDGWYLKKLTEAAPQEVETALINEAKKRGLVDGVYCLSPNKRFKRVVKYPLRLKKDVLLDFNNHYIFDRGVFSEPIETITIQEAEKLLNKKIV